MFLCFRDCSIMWVVDWKKLQMQACRLRSHTVDVTPPQAVTKIMVGMAECGMADGMAEWQKEWQNGWMAGMATYVLFMVHSDTDDDDDDDDDDTLIFYSIEGNSGNGVNGGNGGMAERMAEWQNGRNGYIRTIYGTRRQRRHSNLLYYKPIGPTARKSVQGRLLYHL